MESIRTLILRGKKKGSLTYREIMDALQGVELSADQIDDILNNLVVWVLTSYLKTGMLKMKFW